VEVPREVPTRVLRSVDVRDGWAVDETYKNRKQARCTRLPRGLRNPPARELRRLLVDADDRHQQREDERADDEADEARECAEVNRRLKKKKLQKGEGDEERADEDGGEERPDDPRKRRE
jgi:hypothetical protein